eukprot:5749041-Prymnesium_polylepis.1
MAQRPPQRPARGVFRSQFFLALLTNLRKTTPEILGMRSFIAALLLCSASARTLRQQGDTQSLAMSMPLSGHGGGQRATPAFN